MEILGCSVFKMCCYGGISGLQNICWLSQIYLFYAASTTLWDSLIAVFTRWLDSVLLTCFFNKPALVKERVLSVCQSVCLSVCPYVSMPVCLSVSLSIFFSVCLFALISATSHQQANMQRQDSNWSKQRFFLFAFLNNQIFFLNIETDKLIKKITMWPQLFMSFRI